MQSSVLYVDLRSTGGLHRCFGFIGTHVGSDADQPTDNIQDNDVKFINPLAGRKAILSEESATEFSSFVGHRLRPRAFKGRKVAFALS
jgi:hypothetical protein